MMRRTFTLLLSVVTLALASPPGQAALFDFGFGSIRSTFTLDAGGTTGSLAVAKIDGLTMGSVVHLEPTPTSTAAFLWGLGLSGGDFSLSMQIENISAATMTATGYGSYTVTDTTGDRLTGQFQGEWTRTGAGNTFRGTMSDVVFDNASGDNRFDGHVGFASMVFSASPPWGGTIQELSTTPNWFSAGSYTTNSGSVDDDGTAVVPVPAAVVLALLGLGTAGAGLRRSVRQEVAR